MGKLLSLIAIPLTIIFVPLIVRRLPYFKRPDVVARRAAKAKLPGWVSLVETMLFAGALVALTMLLVSIEGHFHQKFHHGENVFGLGTAPPTFSANFIFWLIQILSPVLMAMPLSLLLANFLSWLIPPIRRIENGIMAKGTPGYTWRDANYGLIKVSLITAPICVILSAISLMRI